MSTVSRPAPGRQSRTSPPRPATGTCRLVLAIQTGTTTTAYRVRPIRVDRQAATKAYRLAKPDGTVYTIAETQHGLECTCPDWTFNRDGRDPAGCKHIKAMVAVGLLATRKGVAR